MIRIRHAKTADIKAISAILAEVSLTDTKQMGKNILRKYLSHVIGSGSFVVLVADENSEILGFCISQIGIPMPDCADLVDVDVSKKAQGRGVGQKLMSELFKQMKKRKIKYMGLFSENVPKTISFYEKQGFKRGRTVIRFDKVL
jgi:ribosomal protein S18 acetylase RimI-like enzyme